MPGTEGDFCFPLAGSSDYGLLHTSQGTDDSGIQELYEGTKQS